MFKEVWQKHDGRPVLLESYFDEEQEKEVYDDDKDFYVDIRPPSSLYDPIYFDDDSGEWKGNTYEEWLEDRKNANNPDDEEHEEPIEVDPIELESAMTQKELFKLQREVEKLRVENATTAKEIINLKGGKQ